MHAFTANPLVRPKPNEIRGEDRFRAVTNQCTYANRSCPGDNYVAVPEKVLTHMLGFLFAERDRRPIYLPLRDVSGTEEFDTTPLGGRFVVQPYSGLLQIAPKLVRTHPGGKSPSRGAGNCLS